MNKICQNCQKSFEITQDDLEFYKKIDVSTPTLCPDCRYQRRLANRNEWNFFKRNCTLCGKGMVSIYNPEYPGPVYCQPCYWSDNWDTLDYGRDFDFSKPFFEQFKEHRFTVPRIALANSKSINSEYTNQASENKDCYMLIAASYNEYCLYGNWYNSSRECVDCWSIKECELCYECLDMLKCYKSGWLETAVDCNECFFGFDLRGCTSCFGCVNLRNKSYCWFNEQLTKEEYEKRFQALTWSQEEIQSNIEKTNALRISLPVKHYHGGHIVVSTGDYMAHNKNAQQVFNCYENENIKYCQDAWEAKDCMDLTETLRNENQYELEGNGWSNGGVSSCKQWYGTDVFYSELSWYSDNLFGCVSMIKKKYCIFNKQYSPEEYKKLKARIITHMKETGEWGEFFPMEISPFSYEDTVAQDYFPRAITKKKTPYTGEDAVKCISIDCVGVGAFRLHPTEIEFYKKMHLPTPVKCFPCRLKARLARRNPRKLWKRNCMKCNIEIETSYSPDRKEIVYCEPCYNKEVL